MKTKLELIDTMIGSVNFLIENPEAQTRRKLAANEEGEEVLPTSPEAVCWCALGRVAHDLGIAGPLVQTGDASYDKAISIADTYALLFKPLAAVGLGKTFFTTANDNFRNPAARQESLMLLLTKLRKHRKTFEGVAA